MTARSTATAVRRALKDAERSVEDEKRLVFDVYAGIALNLARTVDSASEAGDPRLMIAAARDLRSVLKSMGLGLDSGDSTIDIGGGGEDDPAPDPAGELAAILGSGPTTGHSSYA